MDRVRVLIVDDDPAYLKTASDQLSALGASVSRASSVREGFARAQSDEPDAVFLDLRLPDGDGLSMLRSLKDAGLNIPVVMISGSGAIPEAVEALKLGAVDFLVKPAKMSDLEAALRRAVEMGRLGAENRRLKELSSGGTAEFIGQSRAVLDLLRTCDQIAASDIPILIEGETGSGKQVLARYLAARSGRSGEPFVAVNCAAIVPTLFESELFGHEKGAFTGASSRRVGKLEAVGRGTLFLDEIGELPPAIQAKLLTALEDRTFERVGSSRSLRFEGRIIAATNRDLDRDLAAGTFRRDLFYRLQGVRLRIPPLRERTEDIPLFIKETLDSCRRRYGRSIESPDGAALEGLLRYNWPGNVRELTHHVERVTLLAGSARPPTALWLSGLNQALAVDAPENAPEELRQAVDEFKLRHIERIVEACGGNQTTAAKKLGVGRSYLNQLLNRNSR